MTTKYYWWIVSADPETGKPYLIFGSDKGEDDARQKGLEMLSGLDFQIKRLPTRNLAMASSMLKGNRLEQSRSLKTASKRLGHSKSLRRLKLRHQTM